MLAVYPGGKAALLARLGRGGGAGAVASPLAIGVNMPIIDWWIYSTPFMDTAYSAPGNTANEFGGFTGSTTGNPIPDANRDANGFVKSLPGGEAGVSLVCQLPPTLAQRRLSWSSKLGGAAQGCATMVMVSGSTGAVVDLVNRTVTYTPTATADGSAATASGLSLHAGIRRRLPDQFRRSARRRFSGAVLNSEFSSLINDACSSSPVIRFMDWTSVNRNNSAIHQTATAGKAISSITFVGNVATVTTATAHGLLGNGTASASASVTHSGATPATYNVTDAFVKVISPTQYQYTMGGTPAGNASVVGSYTVGDAGFQSTNLHYPSVGTEPGTQFNEPIYTSANRNKNKADAEWHDGVMLESMTSMVTALGGSPYYTVPPNADSTFYADVGAVCASFAAATAKPVYQTVGNEGWNPGFAWFHQLRNEANLRGTLGDALASCRLVATTNIALSGLAAIDGIVPIAGDRILVTGQTTASQNGPYVAAAGAWARAADVLAYRAIWLVTSGLTFAQTSWFISTQGAIVAGTTPLTIGRISNVMRYAEKVVEVANAFRTAFTAAGVGALLNVVAEWQNYAGTTVWDDMAAFVGPTDWAKITHLSTAPYYGDNANMGIAAGYVGSTATLKAAISADIDDTLNHQVQHVTKAAAMGKKFIDYEGGPTTNLSNNAYRTTWATSVDVGDLELRYLQQMELRVAPLLPSGLIHCHYSLVYPFGGNAFSWGLTNGLTLAHTLGVAPKLWAHMQFKAGVRVLAAATGAISDADPADPVGTSLGSMGGSAYGVVWSLPDSDGGRLAINAATGQVTIAAGLAGTANGARSVTVRQTKGAATFDTIVAYNVAPAFRDNFNDNSTGAIWTNGGMQIGSITGGTAVEQNQRLEVTIPAGAGVKSGGYTSALRDLRDTFHFVKFSNAAVLAAHDVQGYFGVATSENLHQCWNFTDTTLQPNRWDGSNHSEGVAFSSTGIGYLGVRLVSSDNTLRYLYAPSTAPNPPTLADFTEYANVPLQAGENMTSLRIILGAFTWDGDAAGPIYFDGFNTAT
jgi:hypothetical protein